MERGGRILNPEWAQKHLGRGVKEVSPEILAWAETQEFRESSQGVRIENVSPDSPGAIAGLTPGDIILSVDKEPISAYTLLDRLKSQTGSAKTLSVRGEDNVVREAVVTPAWNATAERWMIGIIMTDTQKEAFTVPEGEERSRIPIAFTTGSGESVRGYVEISKSDHIQKPAALLTRYALFFTTEDGRKMEVDLSERWKMDGIECVIDPTLVAHGSYDYARKRVLLKSVNSSDVPQTLAHEFRHAQQFSDPRFRPNLVDYRSALDTTYNTDQYWTDMIRSPRGFRALCRSLIFSGLVAREDIESRLESVEKLFLEFAQIKKTASTEEERLRATESLPNAQTEIIDGLTVRDILRLPTLVIERDAEYGSLVALRALKNDTGIDLLGSLGNAISSDDGVNMPISLRKIHAYMNRIGVPLPCVRKHRAASKKRQKEGKEEWQL